MTVTIVGLGPGGLDLVSPGGRAALDDPAARVLVRTLVHPAAAELAALREVESFDHLYGAAADLEEVYAAIAAAVLGAARSGPVVYAVPGSALVGERSVALVREGAGAAGVVCRVEAGTSFLDVLFDRLGLDPIGRGLQVVDGRDLPDPLPLHLPTVVTQVDRAGVLADVVVALGRVLPDETTVVVVDRLGDPDEVVAELPLHDLLRWEPGPRTSLFLDPPPVGWHGLVVTNRRLRVECPWDARQTHRSLLRHLLEETYEVVDAIEGLPERDPDEAVDGGAYAVVEEELGDLLLQVVFHATLAREVGAFDVEEVAEQIRRKLVRRHPHVFGDATADSVETVRRRWEQLKRDEKPEAVSVLDGVPAALPALARADKLQRRAATVGFDWPSPAPVLAKVEEELAELRDDLTDRGAVRHEIGDLVFAVANLARHLGVDLEEAVRAANARFAARFRAIEAAAAAGGRSLEDLSLAEMDELWEAAKDWAGDGPSGVVGDPG